MDVKVRKIDSVAVLDLNGRLTLAENTRKLHCLLGLLLRENQRHFVLMFHVSGNGTHRDFWIRDTWEGLRRGRGPSAEVRA